MKIFNNKNNNREKFYNNIKKKVNLFRKEMKIIYSNLKIKKN